MLFIAYNGFAQNESKIKKSAITTFPNGDEAITIIENSDTNVIKLISSRDFNEYEMLDLSNHEVDHRSSKKGRLSERRIRAGMNKVMPLVKLKPKT